MTDNNQLAAIPACFSDFRLVKGRKVCQLVMEVPIEEADKALEVLGGLPQPMSETWVVIARLETKPRVQPIRPDNTKLSLEAALRCREPMFQRYLQVSDENEAAEAVRKACGIGSRAGLNTDPEAARAWRTLDAQFLAWKKGAA